MKYKLLLLVIFIASAFIAFNCGGDDIMPDDLKNKLGKDGFQAISGFVYDGQNNSPVAGAVVVISGYNYQVTTDADGSFTFKEVPRGTYTLLVNSNGTYATSYAVNVTTVETFQDILQNNSPDGVAVFVAANSVVFDLYPMNGTVTGMIVNANTEEPITTGKISIRQTAGRAYPAGAKSMEVDVAADGTFTFTGLVTDPTITYQVTIDAPGYNVNGPLAVNFLANATTFEVNAGNRIQMTPITDASPYIVSVSPALGVAADNTTDITITFSKDMNTALFTAKLNGPGATDQLVIQPKKYVTKAAKWDQPIKFTHSWSDNRTLVISPTEDLEMGIVYEVYIANTLIGGANSVIDTQGLVVVNHPGNAGNSLYEWNTNKATTAFTDMVAWWFQTNYPNATVDATSLALDWENVYNTPAAVNIPVANKYNKFVQTDNNIADVNNEFATPIPHINANKYRILFQHVANARRYELFRVEENGAITKINMATDDSATNGECAFAGDNNYVNGETGAWTTNCNNELAAFTHIFETGVGINADGVDENLSYLKIGTTIVVNYVQVDSWKTRDNAGSLEYYQDFQLYIIGLDGEKYGPFTVNINLGSAPTQKVAYTAADAATSDVVFSSSIADASFVDNDGDLMWDEFGDNDTAVNYNDAKIFLKLNRKNFPQPSADSNGAYTGVSGFNVYVKKGVNSDTKTDRGTDYWMLVNRGGIILNHQLHGDYIYLPLELYSGTNDFFELDEFFDDGMVTPFSNANTPIFDIRVVSATGLEGPSMYSNATPAIDLATPASNTAVYVPDTEVPELASVSLYQVIDTNNRQTLDSSLGLLNTTPGSIATDGRDVSFRWIGVGETIFDRRGTGNYPATSGLTFHLELEFDEYMTQKAADGSAIVPALTAASASGRAASNVTFTAWQWVGYNKLRLTFTTTASKDIRGGDIAVAIPAGLLSDTTGNAFAARTVTFGIVGPVVTGQTVAANSGYSNWDSDNSGGADMLAFRNGSTAASLSTYAFGDGTTNTAVTVIYTFSHEMDKNDSATITALGDWRNQAWSTDGKTLTITWHDNGGDSDFSNQDITINLAPLSSRDAAAWGGQQSLLSGNGIVRPDNPNVTDANFDALTATVRCAGPYITGVTGTTNMAGESTTVNLGTIAAGAANRTIGTIAFTFNEAMDSSITITTANGMMTENLAGGNANDDTVAAAWSTDKKTLTLTITDVNGDTVGGDINGDSITVNFNNTIGGDYVRSDVGKVRIYDTEGGNQNTFTINLNAN